MVPSAIEKRTGIRTPLGSRTCTMRRTNVRTCTRTHEFRMDACIGPGWYRITRGKGPKFCFSHSQRLRALANGLDVRYQDTRPSIALFIGRKRRAIATSELAIPNDQQLHTNVATIHEWQGAEARFPLFVAEMTLDNPYVQIDAQTPPFCQCHQDVSYPIQWAADNQRLNVHDRFMIQTVLPFTAVVVWFVDDYKRDEARSIIKRWRSIASLIKTSKPQLLLVGNSSRFLSVLAAHAGELFCSVTIFDSPESPLSCTIILEHVSLDRRSREAQGLLFNANHLARLHEMVAKRVAEKLNPVTNLVQMTKPLYCERTHGKQLRDFVALASASQLTSTEVTAYIASSIALHAWPPGAPLFSSEDAFESLYKSAVLEAFFDLGEELSKLKCNEVKSAFFYRREQLAFHNITKPALDLHCQQVREMSSLRALPSNTMCLFCLMRSPQHVLRCGHTLCDICVKSLGRCTWEYCYEIHDCVYCLQLVDFKRFLKPPTCGIRALSLDGGGIRGVISLENILLLQNDLAQSSLRFLDLFDLVVGTSAGGLHALAFDTRSLSEWSEQFEKVVKNTIQAHTSIPKVLAEHAKRAARIWRQDGIYDTSTLETLFQSVYGPKRKLFGWSCNNHMPKIAVTSTSIAKKPQTFLFTNYNIDRVQSGNCFTPLAYKYVARHVYHDTEPCTWQVARATSAAPLFFPTIEIGGVSYQDGGFRSYNNPVGLCDTEIRQIWGWSQSYDVLLSLGTGYEEETSSPPRYRGQWYHGFMPRIYNNLMTITDNHETHLKYKGRLSPQRRNNYFRMDLKLEKLPKMNDENEMDSLRRQVRLHEYGKTERADVLVALLVASFFFELDNLPIFAHGLHHCQGSIRCRGEPLPIIRALQAQTSNDVEFLLHQECNDLVLAKVKVRASRGPDLQSYVCEKCGLFTVPIEFSVRHPTEKVSIQMRMGTIRRYISGFPHSMAWFVDQLQLDAVFGRHDHVIPQVAHCAACKPPKSKRRQGRGIDVRRPRKVPRRV